jgi:hypothetical protein
VVKIVAPSNGIAPTQVNVGGGPAGNGGSSILNVLRSGGAGGGASGGSGGAGSDVTLMGANNGAVAGSPGVFVVVTADAATVF